jgi:hypothetical protein
MVRELITRSPQPQFLGRQGGGGVVGQGEGALDLGLDASEDDSRVLERLIVDGRVDESELLFLTSVTPLEHLLKSASSRVFQTPRCSFPSQSFGAPLTLPASESLLRDLMRPPCLRSSFFLRWRRARPSWVGSKSGRCPAQVWRPGLLLPLGGISASPLQGGGLGQD